MTNLNKFINIVYVGMKQYGRGEGATLPITLI